ncbi:hypothetical protein ILFOPFJJ_06343 [Ensifer psoraleae]|nr:hypothetical protein [Sinorhizobium psoraleae]
MWRKLGKEYRLKSIFIHVSKTAELGSGSGWAYATFLVSVIFWNSARMSGNRCARWRTTHALLSSRVMYPAVRTRSR